MSTLLTQKMSVFLTFFLYTAAMSELSTGSVPPYLRDEELRRGIELLFFAYRDFTSDPDEILEEYGFGRAHHRVLHFVGRNPGMSVADLLDILRITKQSLSRVLGQLVREGYIRQEKGRTDKRQRLLYLSESGEKLEGELSAAQRKRVARAYRAAGPEAVAAFNKVLVGLINEDEQHHVLESVNKP